MEEEVDIIIADIKNNNLNSAQKYLKKNNENYEFIKIILLFRSIFKSLPSEQAQKTTIELLKYNSFSTNMNYISLEQHQFSVENFQKTLSIINNQDKSGEQQHLFRIMKFI